MRRSGYAILGVAAVISFAQSALFAEAGGSCGDGRRCVAAATVVGGQCKVVIDRSQAAGIFDVNRQTYDDGKCLCYAYTGPETQGQATEAKVADLQERKSCPDAKLMAVTGPSAGALGGGSSFLAGPLAPLLAAGALGGGAAAASGSGAEGTPVSP